MNLPYTILGGVIKPFHSSQLTIMLGMLEKMRKLGSSDLEESEATEDHTDGEESITGTPNNTKGQQAIKHSIFAKRARFGIGDGDKDMAPMDSFYQMSGPVINFSLSLERGRFHSHCPK